MAAATMVAVMTVEVMTAGATMAAMTDPAYRGARANLRYQPSPAWVLRRMR
jgi:hypothetical protein